MRGPLAVLLPLAALALGGALPACADATPCTANADCPAQRHCVLANGGTRGTCRQECQATADCHDPALRCSSLGQCVPVVLPGFDAGVDAGVDAAPDADAADAADAGDAADASPDAAPPDDAAATD